MYFDNQFLPRLSKDYYNNLNSNSATIDESIIKFKMIVNGESLEEFEAKQKKKYL